MKALGWGGLPWKNPGRRDFFLNLHFSNKASIVVILGKAFQGIML